MALLETPNDTSSMFKFPFINWVMECITTVSFAVLINGEPYPFLHVERGFRKGFPQSTLLFLLVTNGFDKSLREARRTRIFKVISIFQVILISHLLFVDDIIITSMME